MFIVMHCGGIPFNGDTIKTKSLGGSETAAYYLAKELVAAGHKVTLFTASREGGVCDGVNYEWHGDCTEGAPLGERYTFYAENTPHDVCIAQRHPRAFERKLASKVNYWWLHDLALVRGKQQALAQMWNIDKILCVSQWHKDQIVSTWGVAKDVVVPLTNAVDPELFTSAVESKLVDDGQINLLYSSRPERGLLNLVGEGGIMERLAAEMPVAHLYVCGYDNTTEQMCEFYEYLYQRCDALSNVTRLGALTKKELADTMRQCDALVYPTQFEEVSCITAMEAMAAGLPFIASAFAALPETCKGSGSKLIPLEHNGNINIERYVTAVKKLPASEAVHTKQHAASTKYAWANVAAMVLASITKEFDGAANPSVLAHHFIRHSDIVAYETVSKEGCEDAFGRHLASEYLKGYKFYRENTYAQHYTDYYKYEEERGVVYGPEDVTGTARFQAVAREVDKLQPGGLVIDYGCAHGHYTVALAKMFPKLCFHGVDIAASNVAKATAWAADEKLPNVVFAVGALDDPTFSPPLADLIVMAEVLEHVGDPVHYIDGLLTHLKDGGRMVITVPYGPWEAQGYRQHKYWRAHLHHFERQDLHDMFGHFHKFGIVAAPSGHSEFASALGSYVVAFDKALGKFCRPVNYRRKIASTMPDQTVSCCMIAKNAANDIRRCVASVLPYVQEVVLGIDTTTTDSTREIVAQLVAENPLVCWQVFDLEPPLETGFDAARNHTIEKANCDWVLWIDTDEVLTNGHDMVHYLRRNQFSAYAVEQHHWSLDPMQVIQVDLPCRLFRNRLGVKFFGLVHEHPELALNKGLGEVMLLPRVKLAHYGYADETVRRARFSRNIGLLLRDRKTYPERWLGKFLWLRDLAQACVYDAEARRVNQMVFEQRIAEGIALWEDLLEHAPLRMAVDGLKFYSQLVQFRGTGFEFAFSLGASRAPEGAAEKSMSKVVGFFASKEHITKLVNKLSDASLADLDSRYY